MWAFLIASALAADLPDWTHGQTLVFQRNASTLRVVCMGTGMSLDLAREQANIECRSEAIRQVQTSFTVRSESVESEKEVALHQEVKVAESYDGVSCNQDKEYVVSDGDQTKVYIRCNYNLRQIRVTKSPAQEPVVSLVRHADTISEDVPETPAIHEQGYKRSADRHILLSSVPGGCSSVIINGTRPARVSKCTGNPQLVTVSATDKELIVRPKNNGLLPKKILIKEIPGTLEVQYEAQ